MITQLLRALLAVTKLWLSVTLASIVLLVASAIFSIGGLFSKTCQQIMEDVIDNANDLFEEMCRRKHEK